MQYNIADSIHIINQALLDLKKFGNYKIRTSYS